MKINIASKNPTKVDAVKELILEYPHLKSATTFGLEATSGVSDQPKSLEETVEGATNRARSVFKDCDYSFGIESGLMAVPGTKTGFMDVFVCAIYDGNELHLGLSSAWEPPAQVMHLVLKENLNMSDAGFKAGLTLNKNIGSAEGVLGIVTKGRLTRKEYTKQAVRTALIHLEN